MNTQQSPVARDEKTDGIKQLVYYATKAPSGHNSQPWKFKTRKDTIEIYPDFDYALPVVDPHYRELYISLGCAAENLCIAASEFGYVADWDIVEPTEGPAFVRVHLKEPGKKEESLLFQHIEKRQTNRRVYENKILPDEVIERLSSVPDEENVKAYFFKKGTPEFNTVKTFILKGNAIQMKDKAFKEELMHWIRFNKGHIRKTRDGLTYEVMGSPPTPLFIGRRIVNFFFNPESQNKSDEVKIDSSSHFVVFTSTHNTIPEWIALGVFHERLLLNFTREGISSAYLNPPCELPELADELRDNLPINKEFPALILRIGYAEPMPFSPRREVQEILVNDN